jgi:predicted alpha-1,2-mannosidase
VPRPLLRSVLASCLTVVGLVAVPGARAATVPLVADPTTYVHPLIGSGGDGFTVPGAATPFGMTMVSPDTINPLAYSGYKYEDAVIRGFSLLHVNGAGVPMAGELPFLPVTLPLLDHTTPQLFGVPFTHLTERAEAGAYGITLGNGVHVELAATPRGALQSYTPPPGVGVTVLADVGRNNEGLHDSAVQVIAPNRLEGTVIVPARGGTYQAHFSARFSVPFASSTTFVGGATSSAAKAHGNGAGALLGFPAGRAVTMAVGVSFVDVAGARRNLAHDLPSYDVTKAQAAARSSWRRELSRVRVGGGTSAELGTFYTSLYRALISPNTDSDVDGRYRGADGKLHRSSRPHYENFSLWDTIRGENALLATLVPDRYRDMVASLSTFAREAGALPRWSLHSTHPDYMNGDPAIPTVAEAVCRGIADAPELLYQQARRLSFQQRSAMARGKGYDPGSAANTLENANADFALALMARKLGHRKDAAFLTARSQAWRRIYHQGFLKPRGADGSWPAKYDPAGEEGYREGTGWQYLWLAPHDQGGLQRAYDKDGYGYADRLDRFFSVPVSTVVPGLPVVPQVHSAETVFGTVYHGEHYVPGNEHDLQAPYSYNWSDRPSTGQAVISAQRSLFFDNPYGLPGNDDLGSMAAWWVWAAIGFYPSVPGAPLMVVGTPLFPRVEIALGGRKPFVVDAPGASAQTPYIAGASLSGKRLSKTWFPASALRPGGALTVEMSGSATTWGSSPAAHPPSVSVDGLAPFGC